MHLRRHLLTTAAAGALSIAGLAIAPITHALAGGPGTLMCADNNSAAGWRGTYGQADDIPILGGSNSPVPNSPVTLALEVSYDQGYHAALCYSTTPYATPGGQGGNVAVDVLTSNANTWSNPGPTPNAVNTECGNDTTNSLILACPGYANPTLTTAPCGGFTCGGSATLSVPFSVCLGTNLTGPSICGSGAPAVGATGVVLSNVAVGEPPTGTNQGTTVTPNATIYVDGIALPSGPLTTGAGANLGTGFGQSVQVCVVICEAVPSAWAGVPAGPAPMAVIDVAGVQVNLPNVLTSPACVSTPGATCPPPY